jgi:hypothetical protein
MGGMEVAVQPVIACPNPQRRKLRTRTKAEAGARTRLLTVPNLSKAGKRMRRKLLIFAVIGPLGLGFGTLTVTFTHVPSACLIFSRIETFRFARMLFPSEINTGSWGTYAFPLAEKTTNATTKQN